MHTGLVVNFGSNTNDCIAMEYNNKVIVPRAVLSTIMRMKWG